MDCGVQLSVTIRVPDEPIYVEPGDGPWRLYVYDRDGFHSGGKWFRKGPAKYPEEEIPAHEAVLRAGLAVGHGLEVRIADGGDMLVFHARDGAILHGRGFWKFLVAVADRELKEKERLTPRTENG